MKHYQVFYMNEHRMLLPMGGEWPPGHPVVAATTPPVSDEAAAAAWCDAHGYPAGQWSRPELVEGEQMTLDYEPPPRQVVNIKGKSIALTFTLACLLLACTMETPSMEQPRGTASTITTNVQPPYDHADPATPPQPGWFQQDAGQPPTILTPEVANDIVGEILYLQDTLGYQGYAAEGDQPNRDALAQVLESATLPGNFYPMVSGTDAVTDRISYSEQTNQHGEYRRHGQVVTMTLGTFAWTNADNAKDAMELHVDLPFKAHNNPNEVNYTGTVSVGGSTFRSQNGPVGAMYEPSVLADATRCRISYVPQMGGATTYIKVGDGDGEGAHVLRMSITYRTDGVRNTRMPIVRWVTRGAAVTPLGSPKPTLVEWRADGLVPGDEVRLYERVTVPSPADVLVPGGVAIVANTPKDRGTFDLSALGVSAGNYKLKISRTLATQPELAEFESALLPIPSV